MPVAARGQTLRQWLAEAPFALAMSSGFFGFFAHCGVLTTLEDEGLLPVRVSGSSAGALVLGAWAAGVDAAQLGQQLLALRRADFWDPSLGPGLLRGELFRRRLEELLPVPRFEQCRAPVVMSVFDLLSLRTRTLSAGPLAPAIHASCAVPLLFRPVWISGRPVVDGGVADRPGLAGMPGGTRLLFHHLASRSPWRLPGGESMKIPARPGMTSLVISGLPRVNPLRLERGARAFEVARAAARRALDRPVTGSTVQV